MSILPNFDKKTMKLWNQYCAELQVSEDEINDEIRQCWREDDDEYEEELASYKSRGFLYRLFHTQPVEQRTNSDFVGLKLAYFEPTFEGFFRWLARREDDEP